MRIGQLAKKTQLTRDTIRFYERNGLISSTASNNPNNTYRDYDDATILTLEMIREAQAAGFTIAELLIYVNQLSAAPPDDFDGEAFLQDKIDEVEANIRRSRNFLATLKATKAALA